MPFENPLDRIIIPGNGPQNDDPYVDIGNAINPDGSIDETFAGIGWYSPGSLPDGYSYIIRIAETDPDTTVFVIQLYDANNPGAPVKSVLSAVYTASTDTQVLSIGNITDELEIGTNAPLIRIQGKVMGWNTAVFNDRNVADTKADNVFAPIAGAGSSTLTKPQDDTDVMCLLNVSLTSTVANTTFEAGLRFTPAGGGAATDITMMSHQITAANQRVGFSAVEKATTLPAEVYTVTPIWRRPGGGGTGTLTVTAAGLDSISHATWEVRQP